MSYFVVSVRHYLVEDGICDKQLEACSGGLSVLKLSLYTELRNPITKNR